MTLPESDRYDNLERQATQDFPRSWVPSEADPSIVGEFLRLEQGTTAYGPARIVVLKTKDGSERSVWLFHTVLRNEFARVRPKVGELVAVRYLGKKQGAQGQAYESYRVVSQRDEGAPEWDSLDSDDDAPDEWGKQIADTKAAIQSNIPADGSGSF
jgi:hypothetical protein